MFNQTANGMDSTFASHFVPNFRFIIYLGIFVIVVHKDWKQVTGNSSKLFRGCCFVKKLERNIHEHVRTSTLGHWL